MVKKIILCLLLVVIFLFTGCTTTPPATEAPGTEPQSGTEAPTDAKDPEADIKAALDKIVFIWGNSQMNKFTVSDADSSTASKDAMMARYDKLRNEYGVDFKIEEIVNSGSSADAVAARMATQKDIWDMIWGTPRRLGKALLEYPTGEETGLLLPLADVETVDFSDTEKWGLNQFIIPGTLNGVRFGFFPWKWDMVPEFAGIIMYNVDNLTYYNATDPQELIEQNNFTWAKFEEILANIKRSAGEDNIPWSSGSYGDDSMWIPFSNGVQFAEYDEVNNAVRWGWEANTTALAQCFEWLNGLYVKGLYANDKNAVRFGDEKSATFYSCGVASATSLSPRKTGDALAAVIKNFSICSFPWGPNGNKETVSANVYWTTYMNFLVNASENDPDVIGYVCDILFDQLDGRTTWKEYAQEFIFHNQGSYDNLIWMLDHCNYDYSMQLFDTADAVDPYLTKLITDGTSVQEMVDACKAIAQTEVLERLPVEVYKAMNQIQD